MSLLIAAQNSSEGTSLFHKNSTVKVVSFQY